jgi:RHS repeat-associated protein
VTDLETAGAVLWPLADHLGTIRDIAQREGGVTTIANHRVYDSFGNLISETNSAVDLLFGFTGLFWDEATEQQWNRARWYDPRTAKFTSEDPSGFRGGDTNLSRYVGNSPTGATDPDGLQKIGLSPRITPRLPLGSRPLPPIRVAPQAGPKPVPTPAPKPSATPKPGPALDPAPTLPGGNPPPPQVPPRTQGDGEFDPCKGRLRYIPSPKHGPHQRGNIAPAPTDGARSIENSIPVKGTSRVRVGIDPVTNEFVVFRETNPGTCEYHGYRVPWGELTQEMQNALKKAGKVTSKGKPIQGTAPGSTDESSGPSFLDRLRSWLDNWINPLPGPFNPDDHFA